METDGWEEVAQNGIAATERFLEGLRCCVCACNGGTVRIQCAKSEHVPVQSTPNPKTSSTKGQQITHHYNARLTGTKIKN